MKAPHCHTDDLTFTEALLVERTVETMRADLLQIFDDLSDEKTLLDIIKTYEITLV